MKKRKKIPLLHLLQPDKKVAHQMGHRLMHVQETRILLKEQLLVRELVSKKNTYKLFHTNIQAKHQLPRCLQNGKCQEVELSLESTLLWMHHDNLIGSILLAKKKNITMLIKKWYIKIQPIRGKTRSLPP